MAVLAHYEPVQNRTRLHCLPLPLQSEPSSRCVWLVSVASYLVSLLLPLRPSTKCLAFTRVQGGARQQVLRVDGAPCSCVVGAPSWPCVSTQHLEGSCQAESQAGVSSWPTVLPGPHFTGSRSRSPYGGLVTQPPHFPPFLRGTCSCLRPFAQGLSSAWNSPQGSVSYCLQDLPHVTSAPGPSLTVHARHIPGAPLPVLPLSVASIAVGRLIYLKTFHTSHLFVCFLVPGVEAEGARAARLPCSLLRPQF